MQLQCGAGRHSSAWGPSIPQPFPTPHIKLQLGNDMSGVFSLQQYQSQLFQQTEDVDGKTEIIIKVGWGCLVLWRAFWSLSHSI